MSKHGKNQGRKSRKSQSGASRSAKAGVSPARGFTQEPAPDRATARTTSARRTRLLVLGTLALLGGAVLTVGDSPSANALDKETLALVDLCEARVGPHRQRMAIAKLANKETTNSRKALERLAASKDDRLAAMAIGGLCRDGSASAHDAVKDILEDDKRSDFIRCASLGAHCEFAKQDGDDWNDAKSYVNARADGDEALDEMASALAKKLWNADRGTEGGSDE